MFAWLQAFFATIGVFVLAGLIGGMGAGLVGVWETPVAGTAAAFFVVLAAYVFAPSHRLAVALVVPLSGAFAAWKLVGQSDFPESYGPYAYQPTRIPFLSTIIGGLAAFAMACFLDRRVEGSRHGS